MTKFQSLGLLLVATAVVAFGCANDSAVGVAPDPDAGVTHDVATVDSVSMFDAGVTDLGLDQGPDITVDVPVLCRASADCAGQPTGAVCDTATGRCVACLATEDACPDGQHCDGTAQRCVAGCRNDQGCANGDAGAPDGGAGGALRCDTRSHQCVACVTDEHCPAGTLCVGNTCVMGCTPARPCAAGNTCCDGACVDTLSNIANCGACSNRCAVTNGAPSCMNGICAVGTCNAPFADCDNAALNGCETNTLNSAAHCGACGMACPARPNAAASCNGGTCAYACTPGFADCDGNPANGCEIDLQSDPQRCGACNTVCNPPNGTPRCAAGQCAVGRCVDGFGDCDGNATNGCETDLRASTTHCGQCGTACAARANAFPGCLSGRCVTSCVMGFQDCDGEANNGCEVDLRTSLGHCGACGRACAPPRGVGACMGGQCAVLSCEAGFANCDGDAANGCEVDLRVDPNHCNRCGNVCVASGGTPACRAGVCGVGTCAPGRGDCDSNAANGCETNTLAEPTHCGACGAACALANATAGCANGRCVVSACASGFADCDGNAANGCETDTRSTPSACGACGNVCRLGNAAAACMAGRCTVASCNAGFADCDAQAANGCETDLATSASACGMCGNVCAVPNAQPRCAAGRCEVARCDAGFDNCDNNAANGCETNTSSNPSACGGCGRVCNLANVAAATCAAGQCGVGQCAPGFADCDGNPANGCEVNLSADASHCGRCGLRCATGVCRDAACQVFGGAYAPNDPGCASCHTGNPLGGNLCGCPSGYPVSQSVRVINDCRGQGTQHGAQIVTCSLGAQGDWAGMYQRDDAVNCGRGCRTVNPFTGACSCPAGTTATEYRLIVDTPSCSGFVGSQIGLCTANEGPRPSFAGAYQVDDGVPGGLGCRRANPLTNACACPAGFSPRPMRVEVDSSRGFIGSQIFFCLR
ncbi:MAG: hypothetical protein JNK72_05245 [Myxococcales bacterium]|nr:hypothetical protein [Myxococcales bacterium]